MGGVTLPPEVEHGIRVAKDYAIEAEAILGAVVEGMIEARLVLGRIREEHRLNVLKDMVDRWLMMLDESAGYLQKAREYLLSVKEGAGLRR